MGVGLPIDQGQWLGGDFDRAEYGQVGLQVPTPHSYLIELSSVRKDDACGIERIDQVTVGYNVTTLEQDSTTVCFFGLNVSDSRRNLLKNLGGGELGRDENCDCGVLGICRRHQGSIDPRQRPHSTRYATSRWSHYGQ